jgi:hypothetical protein
MPLGNASLEGPRISPTLGASDGAGMALGKSLEGPRISPTLGASGGAGMPLGNPSLDSPPIPHGYGAGVPRYCVAGIALVAL